MENLKIASEILQIAKDLVFAAYYEYPAKGYYHNNPTNMDAHIGQIEQKKINNSWLCTKR